MTTYRITRILPLVLLLSLAGCRQKTPIQLKPVDAKESTQMAMRDDMIDMAEFVDDFELDNDNLAAFDDMLSEHEVIAVAQEEEVRFDEVLFDYDSTVITAENQKKIASNAQKAKKVVEHGAQHATIVVEGHACSAGTAGDAYKMALSEKRATEVAGMMKRQGLSGAEVKVVGCGAEKPKIKNGVALTGSAQQQAENRRAEVRVIA